MPLYRNPTQNTVTLSVSSPLGTTFFVFPSSWAKSRLPPNGKQTIELESVFAKQLVLRGMLEEVPRPVSTDVVVPKEQWSQIEAAVAPLAESHPELVKSVESVVGQTVGDILAARDEEARVKAEAAAELERARVQALKALQPVSKVDTMPKPAKRFQLS